MSEAQQPEPPQDNRTDEEQLADLQRRFVSRPQEATPPAAQGGSTKGDDLFTLEVIDQRWICAKCGASGVNQVPKLFARTSGAEKTIRACGDCQEAEERERVESEAAAARADLEEQVAARRAKIMDHMHEAGVNVWDHGHCTLDNYDDSESGPEPVEAVRDFLREVKGADTYTPVRGLYLFGATGSGKSHLAAAAARELLLDVVNYPKRIVFDHALRLIGRIQRTYSNDESADAVLNRRIKAKVWILDDLGTEAPSADVVRRLTEIFTERAMRPTIVTSNLAPDQLEGRHAELFRVVSRLGPRYFRTVRVKGSDRRFMAA